MDFRTRIREIANFLQPYQRIWQNEIMLDYPDPISAYPEDWIKELASFREKDEIIQLEKKNFHDLVKGKDLLEFIDKINQLSEIPFAPSLPKMPENHFTFLFVIPKKQYEIRNLAPFINQFYQEKKLEGIIDIGGGIGLLAQTLNNEYGLKVTSLDMDPELQRTGLTRHEKNARNPENKVQYLNIKVDSKELKFTELLKPNIATVGLHTCGPLAIDQVRATANARSNGIINFGCCYNRLSDDDQNLSSFAKSLTYAPVMNKFALTLAARAHRKMDEKDYHLKQRVKFYRYAIHILLHDLYGHKKLMTLGNSNPKLYDEKFSVYVVEQFKRINLESKQTPEEIDSFFESQRIQVLVWNMITAGLIRNAFGRLLELYLQLDRALYLEEQGYKTSLFQFFDEEKSPRNLGIVASLS
jgi:2-polyprenyl-3-methyl-5-hydroxy-6-metoxy-1,4-benzoquinol methylase